jgi:hypothetical protein
MYNMYFVINIVNNVTLNKKWLLCLASRVIIDLMVSREINIKLSIFQFERQL